MLSISNSVSLASIVGLFVGFLSVTALLPDGSHEGVKISQAEYGDRWPFSIEQGRLRCEEAGAVILTANGKDYAVNGMAGGRYASVQSVLNRTNHSNVDIGPIISRGLTLCNW